MTNHDTCTVVIGAPMIRCGAPAVASFTARSGERFGECATHVSDHLLFGDVVFAGTFEVSA